MPKDDHRNFHIQAQALIDGEWHVGERMEAVRDPYRGEEVGQAPVNTLEDCGAALDAARRGAAVMAEMPPRERANLLRAIADRVDERAEEIALAMTRETGKAIKDSRFETERSAETLRLCAEEAVRIEGAHIPMDASPIGSGKIGMVLRFPVGVVSAITPFNAPVNMVAHKLGPAIAAGNASVLKPSPMAPLSVHRMIECFVEAGLPRGAVNVLYGDAVGPMMVSDDRVDFVSFTGSTKVGKIIRREVGMKRVALELGGVGPTIVHGDADLPTAATACARNAMLLAGQSCISVQNVFVHRSVADRFTAMLLEEAAKLVVGDPLDPATDVGTLIDAASAERVMGMVGDATKKGARVLAGGEREGALMRPTILSDVSKGMRIVDTEVFGPAMSVIPYDEVEMVMEGISSSRFGLQCGIFTSSVHLALKAIKGLRTGGVIVNGTSRWRSDQMPYGGVRDSGIGREGPKFSIRDMMDERFFVLN
ncbi:MAG: aldehyde dehydrogenase family protein [Rhodospirillum sp.]|nr:aldehyde dehydrogenase family protein [Rhodospirillum sp.]MCF8489720.1 aldehyde dehydrogenase family protein [Rhodospirillum sp.]MCF8501810.1 aldehyde dehydrogenase family protein [Rhodospirillum sp.]